VKKTKAQLLARIAELERAIIDDGNLRRHQETVIAQLEQRVKYLLDLDVKKRRSPRSPIHLTLSREEFDRLTSRAMQVVVSAP